MTHALDPADEHFYTETGWGPSTTFCGQGSLARINSGRQYESDVTRTLAYFTGDFGAALAQILLEFGKVAADPTDLELWVGQEWLSVFGARRSGDRRSPDVFITKRSDSEHVLLIIELKGRAWVNGGHEYCPIHCSTLGYSNQIICYADNCWTTANFEGVARLVIGPDEHRHSFAGWGRKGLVPEDGPRYGLEAAFAIQQASLKKWHFAGLRELVAGIKQLPDSPARRDALYLLLGWLDRVRL